MLYVDFATRRENQIMVGFLIRDLGLGFHKDTLNAVRETRIVSECATENEYLRVNRTGSQVGLNRAKRKAIWAMYENALDHAGFEAFSKRLKKENNF